MAKSDLEGLTDKQFESEWTKAAKELDAAKVKVKEFSAEANRRNLLAEAERLTENLTTDQLAALKQVATAKGIESREAVNNG